MMHLTSVLLPAPFSPSRARKQPGRRLSDTSARACNAPNRFESLRASRCGRPGDVADAVAVRERLRVKRLSQRPSWPSELLWSESWQNLQKGLRGSDGAEHASLHGDHFQGRPMVAPVGRAAAIFQQQDIRSRDRWRRASSCGRKRRS